MRQYKNFIGIFSFLNCLAFAIPSPILVSNLCHLNKASIDLKILKGKWFDLARTTNLYKENTWKNGIAQINLDQETNQIEILYSGVNSSNICQYSNAKYNLTENNTAVDSSNPHQTVQILFQHENIILISFCNDYDATKNTCPIEKLDIFIWSREKTNLSTEIQEELNVLIENNCSGTTKNILYSNFDEKSDCFENVLTAEVDVKLRKNLDEAQIGLKRLLISKNSSNFTSITPSETILPTELDNKEKVNVISIDNFSPNDQEESSNDIEEHLTDNEEIAQVDLEIKFKKGSVVSFENINDETFEEIIHSTTEILETIPSTETIPITTDTQIDETTSQDLTTLDDTSSLPEEYYTFTTEINDLFLKTEENFESENLDFEENVYSSSRMIAKSDKVNKLDEDSNDAEKENEDEQNEDKKIFKKEDIDDEKKEQIEDQEIESTTIESTTVTIETTTSITTTSYPCVEINCPISHCNYGRKKDENGCETCDCLLNPDQSVNECTPPYCHPCFYGSYTDENGCESCACKPRPKPKSIYECPKLECPSCNYGSIKDEYGCETCICIRPNSLDKSYQCPPEPTCPHGACKYGSILNDYGCSTCDCLKSSEPQRDECVRQRCPTPCLHGYFTDADGCETCTCKPDWMAPCYLSQTNCNEECEFGTYLDRNGCPSCECLPNPKLKTNCFDFKLISEHTECDEDGYFKPKQCNEQECRCVSADGFPISDFRTNISESEGMNCECAIALFEASRYKAIGFKLYCSSIGNYETIQCVGASCACVNEHGDPLGPSVPIYQKHLLRCEGVYQRVYEKYLSTLYPTTLVPPLCIFHREKAMEMKSIDRHLSIPECDERGEYLPVQCDRQIKYCWCVNTHNGIELYGTRKVGERPNCSLSSG
ncbi:unnamed protein product [Brachionus calyciflorus]|uniref:Uncharacterized protein n=1 Tax=Brachionus calyciflorus TaxID=104777 RepID=A0A813V5V2_9BILA|nr:unnamed protein product [Brachionus calyciflorus]